MTKSVLSTIFGVMQHQNKIQVQEKAPIASWQNDDRKNISIHNLLQMNSGLALADGSVISIASINSALSSQFQITLGPNSNFSQAQALARRGKCYSCR